MKNWLRRALIEFLGIDTLRDRVIDLDNELGDVEDFVSFQSNKIRARKMMANTVTADKIKLPTWIHPQAKMPTPPWNNKQPKASHTVTDKPKYDDQPNEGIHADDRAINLFASAMRAKMKLAREVKGRGGWDDPARCSTPYLQQLLVEHIDKGDPVDVANLAMMLHARGEQTKTPMPPKDDKIKRVLDQLCRHTSSIRACDSTGDYSRGYHDGLETAIHMLGKKDD